MMSKSYWHERAAFQRSALRRSTAGNDVVATILISLFRFFFIRSPLLPFLIEGVLGSKNLFSKSCLEHPKTFPAGILYFSGSKQVPPVPTKSVATEN